MDMQALNTGVYGITLWGWMLILVALYFFAGWFGHTYKQRQNIKKAGTRMLIQFCTTNGEEYWEWVDINKDEFEKSSLRGYNEKMKTLAQQSTGRFQGGRNKDSSPIDWYFLLSDHCFNIWWPFDAPKTEQIMIRTATYVEGYPAPRVTTDIAKWMPAEYAMVTAEMVAKSKNTSDLQAMIAEANQLYERLDALMDIPRQLKMLLYVLIGLGLILLLNTYFGATAQGAIQKVAEQLGVH